MPAFSVGMLGLGPRPLARRTMRSTQQAGQQEAPLEQPQPQPRRVRRVVVRSGRFGALLPGDGVVEQVFTSGLSSFL